MLTSTRNKATQCKCLTLVNYLKAVLVTLSCLHAVKKGQMPTVAAVKYENLSRDRVLWKVVRKLPPTGKVHGASNFLQKVKIPDQFVSKHLKLMLTTYRNAAWLTKHV